MKPDHHLATVTQSNALIGASYNLSLEEKRIIIAGISTIHVERDLLDTDIDRPINVKISTSSYAKTFGLDEKSVHGQLKIATNKLYERSIKFKEEGEEIELRWITAKATSSEGYIKFTFNTELNKHLNGLKEQYKSYKLLEVKSITSAITLRMYELVRQREDIGYREISIEDFRQMLGLEGKYKKHADLRRAVIDKSIKEIEEKTNFLISVKYKKIGRVVDSMMFMFSRDTNKVLTESKL